MMTRTALLRALACVAAAACCVVGVSSPSDAADTPVPVPPSPVSQAPELPLLPGREIKMTATLQPRASDDMGVGERVHVSELQIRLRSKYPSPKITLDECTMLANTFLVGKRPQLPQHSRLRQRHLHPHGPLCQRCAPRLLLPRRGRNDHARAPMVYLHQIASSSKPCTSRILNTGSRRS